MAESTNGIPSFDTSALRESGFIATAEERRFVVTHQTPDTLITGQTSFAATTPTFLIRQSATSVRLVLRSILLAQGGVPASGLVRVVVALDTADRLSVAGTTHTPQQLNSLSSRASGITAFHTSPTATAAGAGTRYILETASPAGLGTNININFKDSVITNTTSSILVYTWATTGPQWFWNFEWAEFPA